MNDPLQNARDYVNYQWGVLAGSGTDLECVGRPIHDLGQVMMAVAEEQRTANLIALLSSEGAWTEVGHSRRDELVEQIVNRLGLGGAS